MATDRRVKYTKMVLRESLLQLMQEKPVSRISIKAICELADINRATYYAHYTDPHDQLNQIEREFVENIDTFLAAMPTRDPLEIVTNIFEYIYDNRQLCCTLLSPNGDIAFEEKISQFLRSVVFASWNDDTAEDYSAGDYLYTYILSGGVGIVKKWLNDPTGNFTARDMARMMLRLTATAAHNPEK